MTVKLYCFGESGNSYKAALAMELAGIDWEPVFVDFFNGEARSDAYKDINPMGEAPVLVDGDMKLSQSGAIQDWIVEQTGKFWSDDPAERREILRWQFWDNHKGSSQFGVTRFLMNFLPEKHRNADVIAFMQGRCKAALGVLEAELATRDWLVGDRLTMADISCCAYLYYPEPFGFERADYPAISAWLDRISETPGWKHPYDLMPGSPADRA
ncbi:glutathione S-transferase family protein [Maritimibacter alkaliphilus]|uniref:Glutathione S-transferase family protein n=1 Tax=Maritimibacter alkaliphilus HTCC2654 TaxID=314271 RepID=A3VAR9_9RHOB|nr:glutathione S-transferase family protein [Maritimibacter alkaliphilus]EAQ15010.1 glutathione S-transferase family protein [Maritimibacter alkaliphilus HTCC2654]TYP80765.1 glutathione S-transferase [Maritimibacter alkaliphilus HTCC2654]